jgi:hypothetical protein
MLTDEEKEEHEAICQLRDDAIAHYGPGHLGANLALRADFIMLPRPWTNLVLVSRHLYGTLEFSNRLATQAARATLLMQRIFEEKEAELVEALNACVDDPGVQEAANFAQTDLGATIGNQVMAQRILTGPRAGHVRLSENQEESEAGRSIPDQVRDDG